MSGHNKWSKIKNVKSAVDAKKGKLFTKLIKEIMVSSRMGGGNPDGNPRLRQAILAAKSASMPRDNIERAIKKGTGELQGESIEDVTYEGYGPGGVALLMECTTDNKNRTVSELRNILKSGGGHLAEGGSVAWMFTQRGQLLFDLTKYPEEKIMEVALEVGAEDISDGNGTLEVLTGTTEIYRVKEAFDRVGIHPTSSGLDYLPKSMIKVEDKEIAERLIKLLELLDDHDDVQKVHSNFDMDDNLLNEVTR